MGLASPRRSSACEDGVKVGMHHVRVCSALAEVSMCGTPGAPFASEGGRMPSVIRSRSSECASWIKSSLEVIIKVGTLRKRQPRAQGRRRREDAVQT